MEISIEQYESAIRNALKPKQIEVLRMLHAFPKSTATAKQLAEVMSPNSPHEIVASGAIGKIGRAIAEHLNVTPELYFNGHKEVPEYYKVVGPYTSKGWKMYSNLKKALENVCYPKAAKKKK